MAHMGRHIFDSEKIFNHAGEFEDFSKLTDQQLQEELQKANEAYTHLIWRVVDLEKEPYKSLRDRLFSIRRELVNRWRNKA
jgi:hypothetical protein